VACPAGFEPATLSLEVSIEKTRLSNEEHTFFIPQMLTDETAPRTTKFVNVTVLRN
jgi:hypothetical protein